MENLNQDSIVDAIGKHLNQLKSVISWFVLLALVFVWASLSNADPIKALGIEISRQHAFYVAAIIYSLLNIRVLDVLLRIGDLVNLLDDDHIVDGLSKMAFHSFVANPFSYFGDGLVARLHSCKGFGLLIITWWFANSSLFGLQDSAIGIVANPLQGLFLAIGLSSMMSIHRIYAVILKRTETVAPEINAKLKESQGERAIATFLGIGIGSLIAFLVMSLATFANL